jgi:phosphoribosylformylglycinamidine cyclo-ligase
MSLYSRRGVSAQKEEVHRATARLNQGLFPHAFCKLYPDHLGGDKDWVNVMHADGAGTKSILAYLYWKETGDVSVWKGIAQDAVVMNLDDLLCAGIYDNILFSSTIDRNKRLIPAEILEAVINGTQELFESLAGFGVNIHYLGGETADVGDVVRTIAVNGTMSARWPVNRVVSNDKIQAGDVIVGFASYGQAVYEDFFNSGIGSNGLTSARHDMLNKSYAQRFTESYDTGMADDVAYIGPYRFNDELPGAGYAAGTVPANGNLRIADLILSPTRTYAPLLKQLLEQHFDAIHGLIHCSGGGQTKCMKYLPADFRIVKDNMLPVPPVFDLIRKSSGSDSREMYQVFNMGCRLEVFTDPSAASEMIGIAAELGIKAQITGQVSASGKKELILQNGDEQIIYG